MTAKSNLLSLLCTILKSWCRFPFGQWCCYPELNQSVKVYTKDYKSIEIIQSKSSFQAFINSKLFSSPSSSGSVWHSKRSCSNHPKDRTSNLHKAWPNCWRSKQNVVPDTTGVGDFSSACFWKCHATSLPTSPHFFWAPCPCIFFTSHSYFYFRSDFLLLNLPCALMVVWSCPGYPHLPQEQYALGCRG